jgi:hypothetical protein
MGQVSDGITIGARATGGQQRATDCAFGGTDGRKRLKNKNGRAGIESHARPLNHDLQPA